LIYFAVGLWLNLTEKKMFKVFFTWLFSRNKQDLGVAWPFPEPEPEPQIKPAPKKRGRKPATINQTAKKAATKSKKARK
jgi:hypothetical protein